MPVRKGDSRRTWLQQAAAGAWLGGSGAAAAPPERPNILYIHSHDTGRYIEPYGFDVPAPNLRKLAREGMMFRQAFDAAPTCSPSRASLLTGHAPHNNGMLGLAHRGFALQDYRQHILHTLRPHGYRSTLIGVQHIANDPAVIGYDEVFSSPSYNQTDSRPVRIADVVAAGVRFLKNAPRQPFFLDVGFRETHRAFPPPGPEQDQRFTQPPSGIPDTPSTRLDMAAFHASAQLLDRGMGDILDTLESTGLAEKTLVVCTTDHGIAFPGMKCNLTTQGTGVFLIFRGPGGFKGGKVCDSMVSQLDIYPTICDLVGIERPAWLQGRSLLPLAEDPGRQLHEELFAEVNYHAAYEPMRAARTAQWNYVRRFGGRSRPVLPNCDDSPSKDVWLEHGWRTRAVAGEELYDVVFDPTEKRTLAADAAYAGPLAEMRARLEGWMRRTNDPLLSGPVRAPAGAVVNDPDGTSPREPVRSAG